MMMNCILISLILTLLISDNKVDANTVSSLRNLDASFVLNIVSNQQVSGVFGSNPCVGIASDKKTLQVKSDCSNDLWIYDVISKQLISNGLNIKLGSSNNGAVEVGIADTTIQVTADNHIINANSQCLGAGSFVSASNFQFLSWVDCSKSEALQIKFGAAAAAPQVPVVPGGAVAQVPVVPGASSENPSANVISVIDAKPNAGSTKDAVQKSYSSGGLSESDHYLCACLLNRDGDQCVAAINAACVVGHLKQDLCRDIANAQQKKPIMDEILRVVEQGTKCRSYDKDKIAELVAGAKLPVNAFHGQNMVTAEDHYLCVCLDRRDGVDANMLDQQCESAVKVACIVGHIPETDCYASFDDKNHGMVVQHVLRLIERGANCKQNLVTAPTKDCPDPPCYDRKKHTQKSNEPSAKDHYLCPCLEDHESEICKGMVTKACDRGHIPSKDCKLFKDASYFHSVTRHILHLIDHGAECGVGETMRFTNNRCHCKQSWKDEKSGETYKFPDNCRDPGNRRGYDWCETFATEGCVGVGGSESWDRCDAPEKPLHRLGSFVQTSEGKVVPVDHYLCPCLDSDSSDQLCVAAAKAGCAIGDIPSEYCAESFERNDHTRMSTHIISLIKRGELCHTISRDYSSGDDEVPEQSFVANHNCMHGTMKSNSDIPNCVSKNTDTTIGTIVGQTASASPRECQSLCSASGQCSHGVYKDGTCYMKSGAALDDADPFIAMGSYGIPKDCRDTAGVEFCECYAGFAGARCDFCTEGYFNYPSCKPKVECSEPCVYGECDLNIGKCVCAHNHEGPTCAKCIYGWGPRCTGSTMIFLFFVLVLIGTFVYLFCCTGFGTRLLQSMFYSSNSSYQQLNQHFDDLDFDEDALEELASGTTEKTAKVGVSHSDYEPATHLHTGLAI